MTTEYVSMREKLRKRCDSWEKLKVAVLDAKNRFYSDNYNAMVLGFGGIELTVTSSTGLLLGACLIPML